MTVTDEELTAYADGALSEAVAARVAAAVAADPTLAGKLAAQHRLRALLRGTFDPVAAEQVPEELTLLIAAAAAQEAEEEMTDADQPSAQAPVPPPSIIDLGAVRRQRETGTGARGNRPRLARGWGIGLAVAASLVLGLMIGTRLHHGDVTERSGMLLASGNLSRRLDSQLASQPTGDFRILASFQRKDGNYCRVYAAATSSGIACKDAGEWVLERVIGNTGGEKGADYRQAGSSQTDLMAAAQDMAAGDPLDAAQERAVAAGGWRK